MSGGPQTPTVEILPLSQCNDGPAKKKGRKKRRKKEERKGKRRKETAPARSSSGRGVSRPHRYWGFLLPHAFPGGKLGIARGVANARGMADCPRRLARANKSHHDFAVQYPAARTYLHLGASVVRGVAELIRCRALIVGGLGGRGTTCAWLSWRPLGSGSPKEKTTRIQECPYMAYCGNLFRAVASPWGMSSSESPPACAGHVEPVGMQDEAGDEKPHGLISIAQARRPPDGARKRETAAARLMAVEAVTPSPPPSQHGKETPGTGPCIGHTHPGLCV